MSGGGGNSSGIIIVLMLFCCMMSIMGLAGFWTCTGGTFDGVDFDSAKCTVIPGGEGEGEGDGDEIGRAHV